MQMSYYPVIVIFARPYRLPLGTHNLDVTTWNTLLQHKRLFFTSGKLIDFNRNGKICILFLLPVKWLGRKPPFTLHISYFTHELINKQTAGYVVASSVAFPLCVPQMFHLSGSLCLLLSDHLFLYGKDGLTLLLHLPVECLSEFNKKALLWMILAPSRGWRSDCRSSVNDSSLRLFYTNHSSVTHIDFVLFCIDLRFDISIWKNVPVQVY